MSRVTVCLTASALVLSILAARRCRERPFSLGTRPT